MNSADEAEVRAMMRKLWQDESEEELRYEAVFVWEREDGAIGGCIVVGLRPWAEGCLSAPCPYIEGCYVEPDLRRCGVGVALVQAVEAWCIGNGYDELGSDAEVTNETSLTAHAKLGFEATVQIQHFCKRLR